MLNGSSVCGLYVVETKTRHEIYLRRSSWLLRLR